MNGAGDSGVGVGGNRDASAFTLLELVIALAAVAILLALAVPGYQRYVQRVDRAEAVRSLLAAAACQERTRAAQGAYDTGRCLDGLGSAAYAFRFEPVDDAGALAFTVFADPRRADAADRCGALSLDQAGTRGISGAAAVGDCWGGR